MVLAKYILKDVPLELNGKLNNKPKSEFNLLLAGGSDLRE